MFQFSEPLLLGLAMGPLCLLTCSPLISPLLMTDARSRWTDTLKLIATFLLGRLSGYLTIGFLCGIIGQTLLASGNRFFWGGLTVSTGLALLLFGIPKSFPSWGLCKAIKPFPTPMLMAVTLGIFSGINLCPPFVAAMTGAVATRSLAGALLFFLVFFLATAAYFPLLLVFGHFSRHAPLRHIGRIGLILSGFWLIGKGLLIFLT